MRSFTCIIITLILGSYNGYSQEKMNFHLRNYLSNNTDPMLGVHLFVEGDLEKIKNYIAQKKGVYKFQSGKYSSVLLAAQWIPDLANQTFIRSIYFEGHQASTMNDTMRVRNNVDSVHQGYAPLNHSYSGQGVLSAVIDTGVDFLHPDLQDADGNTRIIAIWDQTAPFDAQLTPGDYGYGVVWDSASINQGICTQFDPSGFGGHGTTVIGTASGNGFATGNHKGVAPNSSILFVKNPLGGANWTSTIADAVDWIFKVADSLNMPVSINISLGTYSGSHDGKDPAAHYIDSLIQAKRGRLVMASAGNSGNSAVYGNYHLETTVTADTSFTWFNYNPSSVFGFGSVYFDVYADTADFNQVQFAIGADATSPTYSFRGRTDFHSILNNLNTTVRDTIRNGPNILAVTEFYAEEFNGVYVLSVMLEQPDSNQYKFRFMTTGSGKFDVWSATWMGISGIVPATAVPSYAQFQAIENYIAPDSAKVIVSSFQCLSSVVTVGNYNNNNTYIDFLGNTQSFPTVVGEISVNSSRGPTRDNRMKPDIAASGDPTMSCAPLAVLAFQQANEPHKVDQDGMHTRNGGTSIASPVVSGIGVLALEKCPNLNWDEFLQMITIASTVDNFTDVVPNITWGYGKINAFRALNASSYDVIVSGDNSFCFGDSVELTVFGYEDYLWSNGSTDNSIYIDSTANLTLTVLDNRGCWSDIAYINVIEFPDQTVTIENWNVVSGNEWMFYTFSSGVSINWYVNNGSGTDVFIGNGDTVSCDPWLLGVNGYLNVYFILTDANNCDFWSDTLFLNLPSVNEITIDQLLNVFPNPLVNDQITIVLENDLITSYTLLDAKGKVIIHEKTIPDFKQVIQLKQTLSSGIYILSVQGENAVYRRRISKI